MLIPPRVKLLLAAVMLVSLLVALSAIFTMSTTGVPAKTQGEERQLENLIPKHVPLGIKIRKEKDKEFKDLNNENWARDFELQLNSRA